GRNLKEWLQEQFCDKPLEQDDMRLHNSAYVGDLDTLRNLLQEEDFKRRINEKSVWCCGCLPCTPLRIAATAGTRCLRGLPDLPGCRGGPGGRQRPNGALRGRGQRPPGLRAHPPGSRGQSQRKPPPPQHAAVPRRAGGEVGHPAGAHQVQRRRRHGPPARSPPPPKRSHPQHAGGVSPVHQCRLPPLRLFPAAAPGWCSARFQLHGARLPGGSDPRPGLVPAVERRAAARLRRGLCPPPAGPRGQPSPGALGRVGAGGSKPEESRSGSASDLPGGQEIPSEADASVPYQDPQNDGQKPRKPRALPAAAPAHQELPAAPKLTTCSSRRGHTDSRESDLWAQYGNYYFITITRFYFLFEMRLSPLLTVIIIYFFCYQKNMSRDCNSAH
ncbi:unnamed protein product, partial [Tetraodon nigroviridis]